MFACADKTCPSVHSTVSELRANFTPLLHTNVLHFYRNTFETFETLFYLCAVTDSDRRFPECLPNNHRPRPGFSDRLTLSNPNTVACFPIKPLQQPLLLLPGTALAFAFVCVGILVGPQTLCDCLPRDVFLWKRYRKYSVDHLHQSPTQREMEKGIEDGKRDGGHHRKQLLETSSGDRRKVDEWMEEAVPSSDWAGYCSLYPLEIRPGSNAQQLPSL